MNQVSENFGDLITPGFTKIFNNQYEEAPKMKNILYNVQEPAASSDVKDSSVGAFGDMQPFSGTISYDDVYQGYDVTYTHVEFAKGFKVGRKLFDDDLYNIMNRKPAGLALSAARTEEKYAASPFNGAFTGSGVITVAGTTVLNNTEGISLCASGHTTEASDDTQANAGTTALSSTAVEATRILMTQFKNDRGDLAGVAPDMILAPRNLEETAWEIIASKGKVDTADNNANFHEGKYKLAIWDYLSDSNNWFLIDSRMMKMFLQWFDRVPVEFFKDKDFDTLIASFAAYQRYSFGFSDWRWVYGMAVS